MHGGNIGIAALVSLHDCPCEWRQRHMASGQCYLATLQMPLCCNVTPTWLITYHFPRPPPHFHISLFSPVPHFGSSPSSSLLSFPPPHILCFVSVFFSLLRDFRDTEQEPYSVGNPWGNMQRNEYQVCIIQDAYGDIQYLNSAVWRIHVAIEDLRGLCCNKASANMHNAQRSIKSRGILCLEWEMYWIIGVWGAMTVYH